MTGKNSELCVVTIPEAGRPNIASVAFFTLDEPGEAAPDGEGTNRGFEYAVVQLAALLARDGWEFVSGGAGTYYFKRPASARDPLGVPEARLVGAPLG